jgi:hemoglobin
MTHDPRLRRVLEPSVVYDRVGGQAFFDRLVDGFYDRVEADPVLLRLYPDPDDLQGARRRLALFLAQYWGGPSTYSQERGHPRLRMRHAPFAIGPEERDHWLAAMTASLDDQDLAADVREAFDAYFAMAAGSMMNRL